MSRGRAPDVSVIGRSLFADHLSPVLVLFVPLYRLAATPLWLFAVQALCVGACVLPMRALARFEGVAPWVATAAVALNATLAAAAVFYFHPSTLAVPAIAWTLLFARRGDAIVHRGRDRRRAVSRRPGLGSARHRGRRTTGPAAPAPHRDPAGIGGRRAHPRLGRRLRGTWDVHYGHLGDNAARCRVASLAGRGRPRVE